MNLRLPSEFLYQVFALVLAIIVVHGAYVGVIRPTADTQLAEQAALQASGEDFVPERTLAVVIRDFEQEACFILMFWALAIMGFKAVKLMGERRLLEVDLVPVAEGMRILPEDTREFARQVQALPDNRRQMLLPRALLNALRRFESTHSIQDVSSSTNTVMESEAERLETELSMIRYISWAIPSIGFIGTVRGIGIALQRADEAIQGDIAGVTSALGVAFNSTLVALFISIVLMLLIHLLQSGQEGLILRLQTFCREQLIDKLFDQETIVQETPHPEKVVSEPAQPPEPPK